MADPMANGIHIVPPPPDDPMKELRDLMETLIKAVAQLSGISSSTANSVENLAAILLRNTTKEQKTSDRVEDAYRKDEEIIQIDQTLRALNETLHLNEETVKLFKKNTENMTAATNAIVMDRGKYKERADTTKQGLQDQRKYANQSLGSDLLRFTVKNLLGGLGSEKLLGDMGQHERTQRGDISSMRNNAYHAGQDVRGRQLQEVILGKEESDTHEGMKDKVELYEGLRNSRKKSLFDTFMRRGASPAESVVYGEAPSQKAPLGLPEPLMETSRSSTPYRDEKGRFAKRPDVAQRSDIFPKPDVAQTPDAAKKPDVAKTAGGFLNLFGGGGNSGEASRNILDVPGSMSNQMLIKSFTKKSGLHPKASEVAENSPAAFATGFLYLGDILDKNAEAAEKNSDDMEDAVKLGGGGGGLVGDLAGGLFSASMISAIGGALPGILAVALPALGIAVGVAGLALLITAAVADTKKRQKERDDALSTLTPEQLSDLNKQGIVPTMGSGMTETAKAQVAIAQGKAAEVDLSGANTTALLGNMGDSEVNTYQAVLAAKEAKAAEDAKNVGNPFEEKPKKGLLGFMKRAELSKSFYWQRGSDGKFWYSPNASMEPKASMISGDLSPYQRNQLFMSGGYGKDPKYADEYASEQLQLGLGFDQIMDKAAGNPVKFHTGGMVPGPIGKEQNAKVLGGEVFISPPESKAFAANLQKIVSGLTEATSSPAAQNGGDNNGLADHLRKNEELLGQLLEEMRRNTDVTSKKDLKVETSRVTPTPSRQYQRIG